MTVICTIIGGALIIGAVALAPALNEDQAGIYWVMATIGVALLVWPQLPRFPDDET